jgi:hypothetical protein
MNAARNDVRGSGAPTDEKVQRWLALGSLARLARFRARREQGRSWPATLVLGRWQWLRARWRDFTYTLFIALGALLIFVPIPNPSFGPFKTTEDAEGFLKTLWQVEAAALALSLAIIVFAIQAYRSSTQERYGGTLRRFIRASWLQEGYELGVVSLLLIAAVLLGAGHGGPAGSAGAVAAGASLLTILGLPLVLTRALRTTHRDFLRVEREGRLTAAVRDEVDHEVEARLGLVLLSALAAAEPIDLALVGQPRRGAAEAILADSSGSVADINLRRLIHLGRKLRDSGRLTLSTRLYEYVGAESRVLLLPVTAGLRERRLAHRIVTVKPGRRRDETLSQHLDDLEEEAVAAIRAGGPAAYQFVADAYVATLMEFPISWQRYGQEYNTAVAQGIEFFPTGPVDEIRQQFYTNVVEALRAGSDEVLLTAAYLPINACTRALQYRADGLLSKMLGLSPAFLAAAWAHGGEKGRLLEGRAARHLIEFTRFYLQPRLEEGVLDDRLRFGGYVRLVYAQIGTMLKLGVDAGRGEFLRRLDGDWGTLLEHWEVGAFSPHPDAIPQMEEAANRGDAGAAERLAQARANARLAELNDELTELRILLRFGLALWAWRQQPPSWSESFAYFSRQMGGLNSLAEITEKAVSAEYRDSVPWGDWILGTLQEGRVHVVPGPEAVVETFIAAALRAVNVGEEAPALPPAEWMEVYLDHAREVLTRAIADERNSDLPDVAERAEKLRQAIEAGAQAWKDQERLSTIEAPLAPEKVAPFREHARAALQTARVLPGLLRLAGAATAIDAPPENPPRMQIQAPKALFVENRRLVLADLAAGEVGRRMARLELEALLQPMASADARQIVADDPEAENAPAFVEQLRTLVARATEAPDPSYVVLLVPVQWRLSQAVGFSFLRHVAPPAEWGLSEAAAHDFAGVFEGAPVFQLPWVPDDVLYVVDLARYVTAEEWQPSEEEIVTVTVLDEDEARERARHDSGREEVGEDEIVRRWRETALVTVDPGLRLSDQRDASAVTAIKLPASLLRD